jgi:hypothetical protein
MFLSGAEERPPLAEEESSPFKERFLCDRYVVELRGESPPRAQVRRTVREGKGVHREMESEESRIQNVGLTNRKCIEAAALG